MLKIDMILFFDYSLKNKYEMSLKRFAIAKNTCALAYDEAMMGHACMEEGYSLIIGRKSLLLIFLVIIKTLWPFSTHLFLSARILSKCTSKDLSFVLLPSFCLSLDKIFTKSIPCLHAFCSYKKRSYKTHQ